MVRAAFLALACVVACAAPLAAEPDKADGQDLVAKDPLVTSSGSGTTTYFGDSKSAAPSANAKPQVAAKPAAPPVVVAKVSLSNQQMVVSVNGVQRYVWPISSGVSQYPTPVGDFRPQWTSKMWYSRKYDWAPMPNAVFINGGVAVHGTYHTGALGSPASHGCIRLSTTNAKTFYNLVERYGLGATRVVVYGRPNWRDQVAVGRTAKSKKRVYADSQDGWFTGSDVAKGKSRGGYVMVDGQPRKVYRRKNGDLVLSDGPRRRSPYKTYGYGYGYGYDGY